MTSVDDMPNQAERCQKSSTIAGSDRAEMNDIMGGGREGEEEVQAHTHTERETHTDGVCGPAE